RGLRSFPTRRSSDLPQDRAPCCIRASFIMLLELSLQRLASKRKVVLCGQPRGAGVRWSRLVEEARPEAWAPAHLALLPGGRGPSTSGTNIPSLRMTALQG